MTGEKETNQTPIFWRRLDVPGHEFARLLKREEKWVLEGGAVFFDQQKPCRLNYVVVCDPGWRTTSARVEGWVGERSIGLEISVDAAQIWRMNGVECPAVAGCLDLDLNFSPSTNLLPIRRTALRVGQSAEMRVAWLRFPSFTLEPLPQIYTRTGYSTYHYESAGGAFTADLTTNPVGFVIAYLPFWAEA